MTASIERGKLVTSSKLLRRLEKKGFIKEPHERDRPTLPSRRSWGGKRGYCYVSPLLTVTHFDFEGSSYAFRSDEVITYIYRIESSRSSNRNQRTAYDGLGG
jgi:hypothetical protein